MSPSYGLVQAQAFKLPARYNLHLYAVQYKHLRRIDI